MDQEKSVTYGRMENHFLKRRGFITLLRLTHDLSLDDRPNH